MVLLRETSEGDSDSKSNGNWQVKMARRRKKRDNAQIERKGRIKNKMRGYLIVIELDLRAIALRAESTVLGRARSIPTKGQLIARYILRSTLPK